VLQPTEDHPADARPAMPGEGGASAGATMAATLEAAALAAKLRKAKGILAKVQPLLAAIAQNVGTPEQASVVVPAGVERLRSVQRKLDEAVEMAEAVGEDSIIKATLRQHERALRSREQADACSAKERKLVEAVRWDVIELERTMLRSQRTHQRLGVDGAAERLSKFEQQRTDVEDIHSYLTNDLHTISDSLIARLKQNGDIDESMRQICLARDAAMQENAKATQLLGPGETSELYRKAKEREKIAADSDLTASLAECQAEITRLNDGWEITEAKYNADMQDLRAEVQKVQRMKDENSSAVELGLGKQAKQWSKRADDMGEQIALGLKALEEVRASKVQNLQHEVLRSRQLEQDMATSTHLRLEAQLSDLRLQSKTKLRMEELRFGDMVTAERRSVEVAKKNADIWARRVEITRESFKAHAYKTGAYVLAMEEQPKRR